MIVPTGATPSPQQSGGGWAQRAVRTTILGSLVLVGAAIAGVVGVAGSSPVAAASCAIEAEPNDQPDTAVAFTGAACLDGSLPDGDQQDTWVWTVGQDDARHSWTISITGILGTATGVELVPITSAPGATPIAWTGQPLLTVKTDPDQATATARDQFLPAGQYVLGVGRTGSVSGGPITSFEYHIELSPGDPLPPSGDAEPNDDPQHATTEHDAFSASGDLGGSPDYLAWKLDAEAATHRWDLVLQGDLGTGEQLELLTKDGGQLITSVGIDAAGLAHLYDLQLASGTYVMAVQGPPTGPLPYIVTASISDVTGSDAEPNDDPSDAVPAALSTVMTGRLARSNDVDQFALTLNAAQSQYLLDFKLIWHQGPDRRLCVSSVNDQGSATELKCSGNPQSLGSGSGGAGATVTGLYLRPGNYAISVTGQPDPAAIYDLRVDTTSRPAADFETEPNDTPATAVSMAPTMVMRGRAIAGDVDVYRVVVTGQAQTWTVHLAGPQLDNLVWIDSSGAPLAAGEVSDDRSEATLEDAYLSDGDQLFQVTSDGGDYTLTFTPQGPPGSHAELEPDNDSTHAVVLQVDQQDFGRLPQSTDVDVYRFSLTAADHVRLQIDPPADGAIATTLLLGGQTVAFQGESEPGVSWADDLLLQPGDYELWLRPTTPSKLSYKVLISREDPFALRADQEPNNSAAAAGPLPPSLNVSGSQSATGDQDWYRFGPLDQPQTITVDATGEVAGLGVSDGTNEFPVSEDATQRFTIGPVPAGIPLYLHLSPSGDYNLAVSGIPRPTGPPIPAPDVAAHLTLGLPDTHVAAYWNAGQQIAGTLTVTSTASADQVLSLDAVTSHYAWTVHLDQTSVSLAAGATVTVPVTIDVLPDAWADIPVRITVRARDSAGAQATTHQDLTPDRTSLPLAPYLAWSVPDALLGGLDVAATALGATPVPSVDPTAEALLYDGIEHDGNYFAATEGTQRITLTTDLAGDSALPVAGIIIDPIGPVESAITGPRAFTLSLSSDGVTYEDVLSGEVSPLPLDQPFVLPSPVQARFARLRIDSTWADPSLPFAIGEWKVIAQPGIGPSPTPFDVADPSLGGHVVWADPVFASQSEAQRMLDQDASSDQVVYAPRGTTPTWVVGFKDDRAANLSELDWVDLANSNPAFRLKHVAVAISTQSPLGPWQDIGTWSLSRRGDGTVAPFSLSAPTWARFIRFTGDRITSDGSGWEPPGVLRALEVPLSASDLPVVGEWGQGGSWGPLEWQQPPALVPPADTGEPNNTPDTATPLAPDATVTGFVHRNDDVDWYTLTTGDGQDSLTFTVGGTPTLGVRLRLYDTAGTEVPTVFGDGDAPGTGAYKATVQPNTTYRVEVDQPTFNAVFAFDSSGSMTPYMPLIQQVQRAYLADRQQDEVPAQILNFTDDRTQKALAAAGKDLGGHDGARAVLVITDWELAGYQDTQQMWQALMTVRPLIFDTLVGNLTPQEGDDAMHDIAWAGNGVFDYGAWHANGDRAFDRMATWLRRPAQYDLSYVASSKPVPPPKPATLTVVGPPAPDGSAGRPALAKDVSVEIILDTSGSMLTPLGKERRIDVARSVLTELTTRDLPVGAPVAIRVFGDPAHPCGTTLAVPFGPLDPASVTDRIDGIQVYQQNDTPVGIALRDVPSDLAQAAGTHIVLLITDSQESWPNRDLCGVDPMVAVRELAKTDTHVDVVGLSVTDKKARRTMQAWANVGHGQYFSANDPQQLSQAVTTIVSAPFDVFDTAGARVGGGIVGGAPVSLPPGTYRVVVQSDPAVTFEAIVLQSGGAVVLTMPASASAP